MKTLILHGTAVTPEFLNALNTPRFSAAPDEDGEIPYPDLAEIGVTAAILAESNRAAAVENVLTTLTTRHNALIPVCEALAGVNGFSYPTWASTFNGSDWRICRSGFSIFFDIHLRMSGDSSSPPSTEASFLLKADDSSLTDFNTFVALRDSLATSPVSLGYNHHGQLIMGCSGNAGSAFVPAKTMNLPLCLLKAGTDSAPRIKAVILSAQETALNWSDVFDDPSSKTGRGLVYKGAVLGVPLLV